jgi:hypothetical protein
MRYVASAAAAIAVLLCTSNGVEGCSCARGGTVCSEYTGASAVFVGVVSEISRTPIQIGEASQRGVFLGKLVRFSVEQAYKGIQTPEVSVETGNGGGDCGYPFEAGERYLVYAYRASKGILGTGICSRTKLMSQASEDLDYLQGLPESASKSRLSGTVIQETNQRESNGFKKMRRMSGLKIVVSGGGRHFEAFTDEQGVYMVVGLPPGKYTIGLCFPAIFGS